MSPRRKCHKCLKYRLVKAFLGQFTTCKICLYICVRCGSQLNSEKHCISPDCCNRIIIKRSKTRDALINKFPPQMKKIGKDLESYMSGRGTKILKFCEMFSHEECNAIKVWMANSSFKWEFINFDGIDNVDR